VLGWIAIPLMNANLDVILRSTIPPHMQGRVYACRNTLQFFTIPVGYLVGGFLVDQVFEIIKDINRDGTTILLVEQNAGKSLAISDRAYVMENGSIVLTGTGAELASSEKVRKAYLGG
jgi:ABC-type histidine transport system ATPase subunit